MLFKIVNSTLKFILKAVFQTIFPEGSEKDERIATILNLYKSKEFSGVFTKIRFWDAPFSQIAKLVPNKGLVIDLGCGDGILVNYLALTHTKTNFIGVELNKERVRIAQKGFRNTDFIQGDVTKFKIPKCDGVLMIHLLHHLATPELQISLIKNCKARLKDGGILVIAEVDYKPLIKYLISWVTDAFIVPIIFEGRLFNFSFFYRASKKWKKILESEGFQVNVSSEHKGKPFSHVIFTCRKK